MLIVPKKAEVKEWLRKNWGIALDSAADDLAEAIEEMLLERGAKVEEAKEIAAQAARMIQEVHNV